MLPARVYFGSCFVSYIAAEKKTQGKKIRSGINTFLRVILPEGREWGGLAHGTASAHAKSMEGSGRV